MIHDDIGAVIVVNGNQTVGIVTEKDIITQVLITEKDAHNTLVKDVMTKFPISVEHDCSVKEALEKMQKHKIRRLIVTENGALFGLVTERRILEQINFYIADLFENFLKEKTDLI
jgi:predicted transcriptional regulator